MRPFLQNYSVSLLVFLSLATLGSAETLDLTSASIAEINAAFEAGTLTSEKLVELCLARIEAYDAKGPKLNAVIALHPGALAAARALDEERRTSGPRSPLHGIPVVLKDNYDTFDLPTTAGSFMLQDSIPPDDAFVVKKLRDAGAIILAKLNMSEFASGATMSSLIGPMLNPHDLERSPAGSSGGTGVAIAAAYAPLGLGTDTGGSVRGPSAANGIVGLKTTHGLLSRDGIVPLGLSFDTAGPMARNVYDVAVALGIMAGLDPADDSTHKGDGKRETDYTQYLDVPPELNFERRPASARIVVPNTVSRWGKIPKWKSKKSVESKRNRRAGSRQSQALLSMIAGSRGHERTTDGMGASKD